MLKQLSIAVLLSCTVLGLNTKTEAQIANTNKHIQGKCQGIPAKPQNTNYLQSDGTSIKIQAFGDAVIHWAESTDGYTLLHDANNNLCYATKDDQGFLVPSHQIAHNPQERSMEEIAFLQNLEKQMRYPEGQIQMIKSAHQFYQSKANKNPGGFPTSGTPKLLVILSNFSDTSPLYTQTQLDQPLNQTGYSGTGSLKEYFYEISYGQLDLQITLVNWVQVPNNHDYYAPEAKWGEFALATINAADASIDYSQYDNDSDGTVEAIAIIHQGAGQEASYDTNDIWSHMWTLEEAGYSLAQRSFDGVELNSYICQPEDDGTGAINTIGIMCHEIGHLLGAPDFYDTDYTAPDYRGTGYWDLQADGMWNGTPMGSQPAHPNLFTKIYYYNWLEAVELNSPLTINMLGTDQAQQAYYFTTTNTNEYFLLENQNQVGFDAALPGNGMLIYHVDQDYIDSHFSNNDINAGAHLGLSIEDAGNDGNIDDDDCPFPGSSINTSFTDMTNPSSLNWTGGQTNKPITNIAGNYSWLSFDFMGGSGCVPPPQQCSNLQSTNITDNTISLQWTRGLGEKVLIIAKASNVLTEQPTENMMYNTSTTFGMGEPVAPEVFAVYYEDGNQCTITGLNPGTTYSFKLYEAFITNHCYRLPGLSGTFTTTGTANNIEREMSDKIQMQQNENIINFTSDTNLENAVIEIFDINGKCMLSQNGLKQINISHLSQGVYILRITMNKSTIYKQRFIK